MSSSLMLSKRRQMMTADGKNKLWSFGDPNNPLGGWEDHYITPGHTHECHPNYKAHPIGNKYGFMVCVKRKDENGRNIDQGSCADVSKYNGYHKFSSRLYDVSDPAAPPIQDFNPDSYDQRRMPYEAHFIQRDYVSRPFAYNGTGVRPVHTPGREKNERGTGFQEHGFSYTTNPPYKYDVTRLEQPYPVWKAERLRAGVSQESLDAFDREYMETRV